MNYAFQRDSFAHVTPSSASFFDLACSQAHC
ncbi:hypothetical protein ABNIH25_10023 [Acinetobacter baumannii ABNIH25]|nr:hypothetical protein ABNIH2_17826 [Acinetobacter baumannii ABNIH2]EMT86445.1 hypothetical protein ABNIH25_10023 [Acinetobacter baumannii ABNIH25]EMT96732.1 hypothetical protein ABNIH7_17675 [Acinetobacter baumannii ABNIH7]EMU30262.1 hypothetical protein ABNIH19_10069 [Acinetobacter baumannii ABNIH19]EMU47557.1 hypothetical protein ABNIH20_03584 [Acinetobacter baumannii ABNIH20]EMU50440.1 hypothetical protein ABNIH24_08018 [Acinetobacter baumannii ABNIH24]